MCVYMYTERNKTWKFQLGANQNINLPKFARIIASRAYREKENKYIPTYIDRFINKGMQNGK